MVSDEEKTEQPEEINEELTKYKPTKEIIDEVRKQLAPLFADFYPSSEKFLLYQKNIPKFEEKNKKMVQSMEQLSGFIMAMRKSLPSLSEVERKLQFKSAEFLAAIVYLVSVEVIGNAFVDRALLLLIASGCDLHLEPDFEHRYVRHATSLEDLESPSLSLSTKLDFLECNGLPFFSKWIDRTLRNKIAHLDFTIDEKGNFRIGQKRSDLEQKRNTFIQYMLAVKWVFNEEEKRAKSK